MTFGRVAEALPQAIGCVSWQKLVKTFFKACDWEQQLGLGDADWDQDLD